MAIWFIIYLVIHVFKDLILAVDLGSRAITPLRSIPEQK